MHDEHPLLPDLRQPSGEPGRDLGRRLVGHVAAGVVEQPGAHQLGHAVDEPRAAQPDRLDVADHLERQLAVLDLHALDRALGGAHAAADLGGLERRAGGRRGGDHALVLAEGDLAVRAHVDEQPQPLVARHAGGQQPRDDVAADVGAERREHERRRARVHAHAEVGRHRRRQLVRGDDERRHRERLGVDAERELRHRHVAADVDLVDLAGVDARLLAHLVGELGSVSCARACSASSASSSIIVAEMREMTSAPNGCWRLSIERTSAGCRSRGRAAWPPPSSSRGRTRARSRRAVVSPGSTSISRSSQTTAVTSNFASRSTLPSLRSDRQLDPRLEVLERRRAPAARSERWSSIDGSSSTRWRFCTAGRRITWRPTPTSAAFGRVCSGGTSTDEVGARRRAARQPPALAQLVGA